MNYRGSLLNCPELDDLFMDFVKENKIKNPIVLSVTVVQVAETMDELD